MTLLRIALLFFISTASATYAQEVKDSETDMNMPSIDMPSIVSKDLLPPTFHDTLPELGEMPDAPTSSNVPAALTRDIQTLAPNFTSMTLLQGLNKITARSSPLEAPLNMSISFGTLDVTVRRCWKAPPEEMPENKVLLEIWEQKPGEERKRIFFGWMFSSSPGVSALEHPVYDIIVLECIKFSSQTLAPSTKE